MESKFGLQTISLSFCHIDMPRYCIRNPADRSAVYTVAYIGEKELRINFLPLSVLQSIQLICFAVCNGVSGIIDPPQIQNNIRADLTDVDHFETYSRRVAFGFQKAKLPELTSLVRCLSAVSDIYHRRKNAGGSGYNGKN